MTPTSISSPVPLLYSADEIECGRSRNSLPEAARHRRPRVIALRPGVFVHHEQWERLGPEDRHLARLAAAVSGGNPPRSVIARESAAVVHGIPMVGALPPRTQYCRPGFEQGHRNGHVVVTGAPAGTDVQVVGGMRVTTPAQTLVDLACTRSFHSSLASFDWALHEGVVQWEELEELLVTQGRRRGVAAARFALSYADGRSESVGESLSRAVMIDNRLPLPELQHEVSDGTSVVARVDFHWPVDAPARRRPVTGEMHGRVKFMPGMSQDPASRALAELRRSEQIRLYTGGECVAWDWQDAWQGEQMLRRLAFAGIEPGSRLPRPPRRPRRGRRVL